jgi:hypothetical protein
MGPLELLKMYVKQRTQPTRDNVLERVAPNYNQFLEHSGIKDITVPRAANAGYDAIFHKPQAFIPHAITDNALKHHSEPYGYNPTIKAARSLLGGRDYGRRMNPEDAQLAKDQATLYQFLQGTLGGNFEGDTADVLYNKYGIDQAMAERGKIPAVDVDSIDFPGLEDLYDEFDLMIR